MLDKGFKSQKGYSSFKMRPDLDFSSSVGHILPVLYDFLYPGDKIDVSFKLKTRTMPLDAAAFGEFKECIDTFFVPMEQLYHNFKNQIYGILDFDSDFFQMPSTIGTSFTPYLPYVNIGQLFDRLQGLNNTFGSPYPATRFGGYSNNKAETLRLLEHLGFPIYDLYRNTLGVVTDMTMSVNLWNLLAYQKIWYDHYRITDRIDNRPEAYNVDSWWSNSTISGTVADQEIRLRRICQMGYVPYDDDFYLKNYTSPLIGSQSFSSYPSSALTAVNQWLNGQSQVAAIGPTGTGNNVSPTSVASAFTPAATNVTNLELSRSLNTAQLRTLFASEKLLEVTRRAGKHYDAQTLAHFGVKVPTGIAGEVMWLGHHDQDLVIGEVVSTSETQVTDPQGNALTTPLGAIAGRGFSLGSSPNVRFTAPSHGILMSVFYIKPIAKYKQQGLDKLNALVNVADYMMPETDGLGLQPLFGYQCEFKGNSVSHNRILGWQYRFMESKDKPKRILGALAGNLDYWTFYKGPVRDTTSDYYVFPDDANNLFLLQWTGSCASNLSDNFSSIYDEIYENDNFLHSLAIGYNKASKMSVTGMTNI